MRTGILTACAFALVCVMGGSASSGAQAAGSLPQAGASPGQDAANDLFVAVGKSVLVDSARPITRIAVGLGDVAEATAVSRTELLLSGKAAGETSLIVWEAGGGRQFYNVTVRPSSFATNDRIESLRRELRTELPGQSLRVTSENGLIFLRGTVKDLTSSDRAVQIASTAGKVVNLLYVEVPQAEPQVLLKVRFASVDRTRSKQLGLNVFSTGAGNSLGTVGTGQFSPPSVSGGAISSGSGSNSSNTSGPTANIPNPLNLFLFRPDINLGATLQALEAKGVLEVLAEPNLLAANGKQASFLAGGQFPFPVVQGVTGGGGAGAVTIQFKEFGVRLNFIPTITPRGTIRLQVAPEVSSLDFANGVTITGFTVPALSTRRVKTEVELGERQSFVLGGLLDNRENETLEKIPFIGDIPVLGKLFQSISKTRSNTELVVIVTPEIVAPISAGSPLPELNYPVKFLPPNTKPSMMNPGGADVTTVQAPAPGPPTMPVEKLQQSMQPEQPLGIDPAFGSLSGSSQVGGTVSASSGAVSPQ